VARVVESGDLVSRVFRGAVPDREDSRFESLQERRELGESPAGELAYVVG